MGAINIDPHTSPFLSSLLSALSTFTISPHSRIHFHFSLHPHPYIHIFPSSIPPSIISFLPSFFSPFFHFIVTTPSFSLLFLLFVPPLLSLFPSSLPFYLSPFLPLSPSFLPFDFFLPLSQHSSPLQTLGRHKTNFHSSQ